MTMPAGKYYVGDLCYVMHSEWDEFCSLTIKGPELLEGEFNLKDGRRFAFFGTKWGDGTYRDQFGRKYSVDAGLIGCIRIDDIDLNDESNFTSGGQVIEFKDDFSVQGGRQEQGRDWDGAIRFGQVRIGTDDEYDYEEEEQYE